jgi:membrane fusion protein, multidrug efflux system
MKIDKFIVILLCAVLCVLFFSCSEPVEIKETIRPVRYQEIIPFNSEKLRTFSGVSESGIEAQLSFRVSGVAKSIKVVLGQRIKKNQHIASIDDSDAILDYEKAVAAQKNTEVQVETAKSNLKRVRNLYENNNVSLSEYEAAKNKFAAARSDYSASKKNTALKKRELGYYKLYSPMDGIVVSKDANENENVSAGQSIVKINSENDIQVVVGIPEKYISLIKKDNKTIVLFSTLPGKTFQGVVTEISYSISSSSTYPVKINLLNVDKAIRPGMPASVSFTLGSSDEKSYFLVPSNSVGEDNKGNFLFIVKPGQEEGYGVVEKKIVLVGKLTDKGFQILSGVAEGDFIITSGVDKMTDGKKVKFLK